MACREECGPLGHGMMGRHNGVVRCLAALSLCNLDPRLKLEPVVPELTQLVAGQIAQAGLTVIALLQ